MEAKERQARTQLLQEQIRAQGEQNKNGNSADIEDSNNGTYSPMCK
jgi:hypothetical protein